MVDSRRDDLEADADENQVDHFQHADRRVLGYVVGGLATLKEFQHRDHNRDQGDEVEDSRAQDARMTARQESVRDPPISFSRKPGLELASLTTYP